MAMHVRAYIRVSTDEQAEEGFSLATQRQRITDFCRSQWTAPDIAWYEDDGYSARDTDRPALAALRRAMAPGDLVVVLRLDRLTRSVLDLYTLLREWEKREIALRSVTEPYDTATTEGRFMIGLLALLAEWERLRIGERVREVMGNTVREERRHLSRAPYGYRFAAGRLVPDAEQAAIVRAIFERYVGGMGARAIALHLNREGARTGQGARWSAFAVSYILRNPAYRGQIAWNRLRGSKEQILVDGHHEPLIGEPLWRAAQAALELRRAGAPPRGAGHHPLTGLAFCGRCGGPLHGFRQRRYRGGEAIAGSERLYYRCSRRLHQRSCTLPYLPAGPLEASVLAALGPPGPPEVLTEIAQKLLGAQDLPHPDRELRLLASRRKRWDLAYEEGDITHAEWREHTSRLRAREASLLSREGAPPSAPLPSPRALAHVMGDLPRVWERLAPTERKELLHGLLTQVEVHGTDWVRVVPRYGAAPDPSGL